jgi:hypothetical protein
MLIAAGLAPAAALAAMFSAPAPPPPEIDTRSELIAVSAWDRIVIVQFQDRGQFARSSGGRATPVPLNVRIRHDRPCSRPESVGDEGLDPDARAECENELRIELQRAAARELSKAQYASALQASKFYFERNDDYRSGVFFAYAGGNSLRVRIETPDPILGRVRLLGVTRDADSLLAVESLRQDDVGPLAWHTTVTSYDRRGKPGFSTKITDRDGRLVYGDYLVANELGEIGVLRMDEDAVLVEWVTAGAVVKQGPVKQGPVPNAPTELRVDGAAAQLPAGARFDYKEFTFLSTKIDGDNTPLNKSIRREEVMSNVMGYLHARWRFSKAVTPSGAPNECRPSAGLTWARPRSLDRLDDGAEVEGVPYKWGGYVSLEQFAARVNRGIAPGNTCACSDRSLRYCVRDDAVGIDATGFVSRVWGASRQTTLSLEDVTTAIPFDELERGDALVKRGEHARIFMETVKGPNEFGVRIAESSPSCGGVCEKILTARELDGYTPRRYRLIRD